MRRPRLLVSLWAGLGSTFLQPITAQDQERAADPPIVRIEIAGPAMWRTILTPTNLGSLMASEQGAQLWQPIIYSQPVISSVELMLTSALGTDTLDKARGRILDYSGTTKLAIWNDPDTEEVQVELVMSGDGQTDMAAMARELATLLASATGQAWQTVKRGEVTMRVLDLGPVLMLTEPRERDGALTAVIASETELVGMLQRSRKRATPKAGDASPRTRASAPLLAMHIDVATAIAAVEHEGLFGQWEEALLTLSGLPSVEEFAFELGTAGPHLRIDLRQSFLSDDRGAMAAFFPDRQGLPKLANLHAPDSAGWKTGYFDMQALYEAMLSAVTVLGDVDFHDDVKDLFGGDAKTGIQAFMSGDYAMFGSSVNPNSPFRGSPSYGMAFALSDEDKFRKAWQNTADVLGWKENHSEDVEGMLLQSLQMNNQIWCAIGHGLFLFSSGAEAESQIRDLATTVVKNPDWKTQATTPSPEFQRLLRHAPPGLNGYAQGHIAEMYAQVGLAFSLIDNLVDIRWGLAQPASFPGEPANKNKREDILKLLTKHGLLRAYSMTGYENRRWHHRILW